MAEDAENDANDSARPRPIVPKPKRDSALIEGEAREIHAESEPAPVVEAADAPEPAVSTEGLASPDFVEEPETSGAPELATPESAFSQAFASQTRPPEPIVPEPPVVPASAPVALGSGSLVRSLLSGIVGAAIALIAAWFFDPRAGALDGVETRLHALEQADQRDAEAGKSLETRVGQLESGAKPAASDAFDKRVAALEAGAVKPESIESLDKRLATLEANSVKPEALAAALNEVHDAKDTASKALALASAASQTPAAISGAGSPSASQALAPTVEPDPRVAVLFSGQQALDSRVAKNEAALDDRFAKIDDRFGKIDAATAKIDDATTKIDEATTKSSADTAKSITDLNDRLAKSEAALGDRIGKETGALGDRLGKSVDGLTDRAGKLEAVVFAPKIETRVDPAETAEHAQKQARASTRAIASIALLGRLNTGEPYRVELEALSRSGADPAALADLQTYADKGAPTAASLARTFRDLEPAMLATVKAPPADGVMSRIMGEMDQLVSVRRVGETPGEAPDALITQVDGAMSRGDIVGALAAYQRLPDASRAVAADWAKSAQDRAKADTAARTLRDASIADLDKSKN